jgi:hypothetical protein
VAHGSNRRNDRRNEGCRREREVVLGWRLSGANHVIVLCELEPERELVTRENEPQTSLRSTLATRYDRAQESAQEPALTGCFPGVHRQDHSHDGGMEESEWREAAQGLRQDLGISSWPTCTEFPQCFPTAFFVAT